MQEPYASPISAEALVAPARATREVPWRRLFGYLRPHAWRMAVAITGLAISSAAGLVFPLLIGRTVSDMLAQGDVAQLDRLVLGLLALFAVMAVASFISGYFLGVTGEKIVYDLRTSLYERLITLDEEEKG